MNGVSRGIGRVLVVWWLGDAQTIARNISDDVLLREVKPLFRIDGVAQDRYLRISVTAVHNSKHLRSLNFIGLPSERLALTTSTDMDSLKAHPLCNPTSSHPLPTLSTGICFWDQLAPLTSWTMLNQFLFFKKYFFGQGPSVSPWY